MTIQHNAHRCPFCQLEHTASTSATVPSEARMPTTGDVSICAACGGVGLFDVRDGQVSVRRPTSAEIADLRRDPAWPSIEVHSASLRARAASLN